MNRVLSTICVIAASVSGVTQGSPPRIAARDANKFVGKDATICGRVVAYDCSKSRDTVLLNLDKPYWSGGVSIGVRSVQRPTFGQRFEDEYLWTDVCATGRVERLEGRYVFVVDAPASLVLQDAKRPAKATFAPDAVQSCAADVQMPTVTREVKPNYTREAMRGLIQGRLLLDAVVLSDGTVGDVRVIHSLDRSNGLDQQGITAAKQWRFVPGRLRGQTVPMIVTIELSFRLK